METPQHEDTWLLTVPEAVEELRISRSHFFKMRRQGKARRAREAAK